MQGVVPFHMEGNSVHLYDNMHDRRFLGGNDGDLYSSANVTDIHIVVVCIDHTQNSDLKIELWMKW